MGKRLIIAEKPSLAAAIAAAVGLKGKKTPEGFLDCGNVILANARGHLMETLEPSKMNAAWGSWSLRALPMLPDTWAMQPRDDAGAKKLLKAILDLIKDKDVTEIVNACDAGREGQLIFDEIIFHSKTKKPLLRFWTSSLADSAIKTAYAHLEQASKRQGLTDASWCRMQADWMVGLNATRAQTLMAQSHDKDKKVQTVGRVQTPVLSMLVDRELEIRNFKPKDFYTVVGDMEARAGNYQGQWFRTEDGKRIDRFDTEADAKAILAKTRNKQGKIKAVTNKDERKPPEQLFDLTQLQREANQKQGFSADHTLEVMQSLYEAKFTSYPRTNSRYLTPEDLEQKVPDAMATLAKAGYAAFTGKIATPLPKLGKRFVDATEVEDHTAIIPTENVPSGLSADQKTLYDMVARRLIGAYYPDRIQAKTEIVKEIEGETFKTKGTVTKQVGWEEVDPAGRTKKKVVKKGKDDDDEGDEDTGSLPDVKANEPAKMVDGELKTGKTTAPSPYNESDLLGAMVGAGKLLDDDELKSAMKDCGLGTPATRAAIIEELLRRKHIERKKAGGKRENLIPTVQGINLIQGIKQAILKSPELTGQREKRLAEMDKGKYSRAKFLDEIKHFVTTLVDEIRGRANMDNTGGAGGGRFEPVEAGPCEKCGGKLIHKAYDAGSPGPHHLRHPDSQAGRIRGGPPVER